MNSASWSSPAHQLFPSLNSFEHAPSISEFTVYPTPTRPEYGIRSPKPGKLAKRLIGNWQSDKERTLKYWNHGKTLSPEGQAHFESLFGRLRVQYTASHCRSVYDDWEEDVRYSILAEDDNSLIIANHYPKHTQLQQLFFEADHHYLISGYNIEFFRRVSD